MSLGFLDIPEDGLDPVEASSRVAKNINAAMDDLKGRGIVDYLSVSGSDEEFDARLATKGCFEVVAATAERYLVGMDSPTETLVEHLRLAQRKEQKKPWDDLNPDSGVDPYKKTPHEWPPNEVPPSPFEPERDPEDEPYIHPHTRKKDLPDPDSGVDKKTPHKNPWDGLNPEDEPYIHPHIRKKKDLPDPSTCRNCKQMRKDVEGGLCADCFRSMPMNEWKSPGTWERQSARVASSFRYVAQQKGSEAGRATFPFEDAPCEQCGTTDWTMRYAPTVGVWSVWPVFTCTGCGNEVAADSNGRPRKQAHATLDCRDCNGTGYVQGNNPGDGPYGAECSRCDATGQVVDTSPHEWPRKKQERPWDDMLNPKSQRPPWDDFNPRCRNCKQMRKDVEGGLCADCFRSMPMNEWKSPGTWERQSARVAFNPVQDAEDLRPGRCQTEGCQNDAERFGVCSDHMKKVAFKEER